MGNRLFQKAREAVNNVVEKMNSHSMQHDNSTPQHLSAHDEAVAQNAISSAMANSSDAERAQLAELQQELDQNGELK
ncbi:DUF3813 domain-containing protein [Fictibacillus iocasae]|uniref:DUF3813 domain-containing protein n=1 Tax=Fictibacillus iocasae TaxID=2715437 RepID=A0ABW2NQY6_9BACL